MNHILLVNDDIETVKRTSTILDALQWNIDVAGTEEYLAESCAAQRPELVIVDLEMANSAGFDCIGLTRRLFPDIFIIAVTRGTTDKLLSAASTICGADCFVAGPVSTRSLSQAIDGAISVESVAQ